MAAFLRPIRCSKELPAKGPLDNAAMSAIHASNPFEPLPSEFKGPYIRLRIVFLYNLPLDYAK